MISIPIAITIPDYYFWEDADVIVKGYGDRAKAIEADTRRKIIDGNALSVLKKVIDNYDNIALKGTFNLYETLQITRSNIVIRGMGRLSTKIYLKSSSDIALLMIGDGALYIQHVEIANLHIIGYDKSVGVGIHDNGCYACSIVNVMVESFKYGIRLQGSSSYHAREGRIMLTYIAGCKQGVRAELYSNDYLIGFNTIYNIDEHGVVLISSVENTVIGNIIPYGVNGSGIYGYDTNRNHISLNHLFGIGGHGIQIGGASERNHIVANYIQGSSVLNPGGYDAIRLFGTAKYNHILGNYINGLGRTRYGVNTADSTGEGNYVEKNVIFGTVSGRYNVKDTDYCDRFIYTSLPASLPEPGLTIIYYDPSTGTYYHATWDGSAWKKVALS